MLSSRGLVSTAVRRIGTEGGQWNIRWASTITVPNVDIAAFRKAGTGDSVRNDIVAAVKEAATSHGVFAISGGVSWNHYYGAFGAAKEMMSHPLEVKKDFPSTKKGGFVRGYIGEGEESGSERYELKEGFSYGYEWNSFIRPTNPLQGMNAWPDKKYFSEASRTTFQTLFKSFVSASNDTARILALALGKEEDLLTRHTSAGDTISLMRLFHYFANTRTPSTTTTASEIIGSSPHTDWGFLTLILQEHGSEGLQLFHEGEYKDIKVSEEVIGAPAPGDSSSNKAGRPRSPPLLVNCGDYLSIVSGGELKSPLHRVNLTNRARMSFVFFAYPDYNSTIKPVHEVDNTTLSLLQQQALESQPADGAYGGGSEAEHKKTVEDLLQGKLAFGEFITRKWEQVTRKA